MGHVVYSNVSRARNVDTLFFILVWDRYGFHKNSTGTRYVVLMFLHPMGSDGHVVHSGASGSRNVNALFFMLGWDQYGSHKKPHRNMLH
jgi:hypothetical protein